jgi:hypothetical protein
MSRDLLSLEKNPDRGQSVRALRLYNAAPRPSEVRLGLMGYLSVTGQRGAPYQGGHNAYLAEEWHRASK